MAKKSKSSKTQPKSTKSTKSTKSKKTTKTSKSPKVSQKTSASPKTTKKPAKTPSETRVEQLNASIEERNKAKAKKAVNNPAHSDQNLAMDLIPNRPSYLKPATEPEPTEPAEPKPVEPESINDMIAAAGAEEPASIQINDYTAEEVDEVFDETPVEKDPLKNFATTEPEPIEIETENPKLTQDIALSNLENGTDHEAAPVNKNSSKKWRIFPKIITIITVGILAYLGYSIFTANVLPVLHLSIGLGILALYSFFTLFKNFRRKTHTPVIIILLVLNLVLSGVAGFAILKINDTLAFFSKTLGVSDKEVSVYHLIVKKDSAKNSISDLSGKVIHTQRDLTMGSDVITSAVREQANASVAFSDDLDYLISLVTGEVKTRECTPETSTPQSTGKTASEQAAADAEAYANATKCYYSALEDDQDPVVLIHSGTYDGITSDNTTFSEKTKIIGEIKVETNVEHTEIDNITTKPFMIYISGIDTRTGTLPARSLSDVNMVAVVNPASRKLLLVSIPRDYYVHLAGTAKTALPDKLTHAGSTGGVQLSMATISELLDLDLDQYIRVNFNFVENLVNAIGGINIYNDQNYSFSCWVNRKCVFQPGYNYVYGDCALAFARECHAYEKGDRHRGENQQQVIKLVLDKVTSSSTLISKYSEILESLVGTFETTLTQENITDLVKMHVSDMTPWTVETYNLNGTTGMDKTYSYPSQNLSIMYPDTTTIETAKQKIAEALGKSTPKTESETEAETE